MTTTGLRGRSFVCAMQLSGENKHAVVFVAAPVAAVAGLLCGSELRAAQSASFIQFRLGHAHGLVCVLEQRVELGAQLLDLTLRLAVRGASTPTLTLSYLLRVAVFRLRIICSAMHPVRRLVTRGDM